VTSVAAQQAILAQGLVKRYGRTAALRGLDLEVAPGEHVALFGPNGSGKTTLLKVLAGVMRPTRGEFHIAGLSHGHQGQALRAKIGVLSHHTYLYDDLTAEENLLFFGRMFGVRDLSHRVEESLTSVGMERRRRDKVHTLSRGMQQRLALARATLHDPDVLLLDEPDTGLDQEAFAHITQMLDRPDGRRRTVLLATHDLKLGHGCCDRFILLADGRGVEQGRMRDYSLDGLEQLYWRATRAV
jgi:heme exporter protein A